FFFFSSRRRHTRSVSAFLLNRSSDLVTVCQSQFATRRTLFHVLVGCGLLMLKVSRLKLPVIWLLVSMWLNTLTKSQIWTLLLKRSEERRVGKECRCRWMPEQNRRNRRSIITKQ